MTLPGRMQNETNAPRAIKLGSTLSRKETKYLSSQVFLQLRMFHPILHVLAHALQLLRRGFSETFWQGFPCFFRSMVFLGQHLRKCAAHESILDTSVQAFEPWMAHVFPVAAMSQARHRILPIFSDICQTGDQLCFS